MFAKREQCFPKFSERLRFMSSNPSEFARRVLEAFAAAGHATDEEVGDAGGPSTTTLAKYRKVANGEMKMGEPRGDVLRRIDRAAAWRAGSARALWRQGAEPEPPTEDRLRAVLDKKPGRVVRLGGIEGYVEWLAERLTEVEERLDLLADEVARQREEGDSGAGSTPAMTPPGADPANDSLSDPPSSLPAAAAEEPLEEPGEFNT